MSCTVIDWYQADEKLNKRDLTLALSCSMFGFVGTCLDDSAEDMSTIQV